MDINTLNLSENRIKALEKKGLCSVEDIQNFFPRAYYDFSTNVPLEPIYNGSMVAVIGTLTEVSTKKTNGILMLKAKVFDKLTNKKLNVMWIGAYYLKNIITNWENEEVIVCGKLEYKDEYHSFHMNNPLVFDRDINKNLRVYPVYKKMNGISEEFILETIKKALNIERTDDVPEYLIQKWRLLDLKAAYKEKHNPKSMKLLKQANKRLIYDKLLHFAVTINKEEKIVSKGTKYNIKLLKNTMKYIESLPYQLTDSQQQVFNEMTQLASEGRRLHALIQGDVSSGKTVSAFLMMFAMADSGYQSLIMAPTLILAKQHYNNLIEKAEVYGYKVAFLSGECTEREKKKIKVGIKAGEYTFIVGTHSVLSADVEYQDLALAVVDEEHRFGVAQRNILMNYAKDGMHYISMSATPIPRTLASSLYGSETKVYDLQLPGIRKPIQTAIFNTDSKIYDFILKKIENKQQIYVVCPWIEDAKEQSGIATVEETIKAYEKAFEAYPNIQIASVTGKMKPATITNTIDEFAQGKYQILISTTVIEVGVNVPNANVIVINNAERFGLAQLHQLRGRVGRGAAQGYCILKSAEKENPRLKIMESTTNGYIIAEEDMKLRGTGNILGTEQSGQNEYINLILQYPNMYEKIKLDAQAIVDRGLM